MNAVVALLEISTVIPINALKSPYQKFRSRTITFAGVEAKGALDELSVTAISSHLPRTAQDQARAQVEAEDHDNEQQRSTERGREIDSLDREQVEMDRHGAP